MPNFSLPKFSLSGGRRLTQVQKLSATGLATASAAVVLAAIPGTAAAQPASVAPVAYSVKATEVQTHQAGTSLQTSAEGTDSKKLAAQKRAVAEQKKAKLELVAKARAEQKKEAASRAAERKAATPTYSNNLDGWIKESLAIMKEKGIPGTYEGIHRNIMRESSGNPRAINNWDINAQNGVPSKGLLQVIQPTFDTYHVEGTSYDLYDPVANITAACNYAADRYGSIDNVNGPY